MKKVSLLILLVACSLIYGQFKVQIRLDNSLGDEAVLSKLDGSKYVILSSENGKKSFKFNVSDSYIGMMQVYFPSANQTLSFIAENQNVEINLNIENRKIKEIYFIDASNQLMEKVQRRQQKKEYIFPALMQMKTFYKTNSDFYKALEKELNRLEKKVVIHKEKNPFVDYYHTNYNKYLVQKSEDEKPVSKAEIRNFISSSNEMLESSSLLRPLLMNYLNQSRSDIDTAVDTLLNDLQVDTPRGQTVLSELIGLFASYGMTSYEEKYLAKAKGLKCSINNRLSNTIKAHDDTEIGAIFPDYQFTKNVKNTTAKSLHATKGDKKIVVFWSSTCGHCKKDLPELLKKYQVLKRQNIEVIGFSIDTEKNAYENEIKPFKWINDSELRGWNSSYTDDYNINGTPTYFILDKENRIIAKPNRVGDVLRELNIR